ncbi:conserved hypothetical protein [Nitrosococcus halophilus Nc 4]|uniref:Glycine-zipper-containing OmpA-like membrane domain-containing protein n=1 Tax=Nitrosococcus halophilus (strain Nc4) TaxID=472759 RepID=D5C4Q4_NITHN|nr:glycine zipper family protein [Nitrosococcus halophilus]ADE13327.1 conserved hypothetical protein [Nitrosococcus halophilus Nc 4]
MSALVRASALLSFFFAIILAATGCAGPRPILYPNPHLRSVGQEVAEQDIAECRAMAEAAGATPGKGKAGETVENSAVGAGMGAASGAVGGAVVGAAGSGAAIGAASGAAAGLLRSLFGASRPSQAYIDFVNQCLRERGYKPVGWE